MTSELPKDDVFTLGDAARDVGGTLGSTYQSVAWNILKAIGNTLYGIIRTILYLALLIPQVIQLIVFGLFIYILSKMWGSLKSIFEVIIMIINPLIPGPLFAWNVIAFIFNIISGALSIVGLSLPSLPTVRDPMAWHLPSKMPTAIEFAMWVLSPVANAAKSSVHSFVYAN